MPEPLEIEGALLNCPHDGEAFQLDRSIALLSWSKGFGPTSDEQQGPVLGRLTQSIAAVSYTHLTLPTKAQV